MITVIAPSKNKINGNYSSSHPGYDHDDVPVKEYYASFDGQVTTVVNQYSSSWIANTPSDPWYVQGKVRPLVTADYGNYFIITADNGVRQLAAHFPKDGIIVKVGQRVKAGQLVAIPPGTENDTGNSTGGHTHTEYRDINNIKMQVVFTTDEGSSMNEYKGYNLDDKESMKVAVDSHIRVVNREVIPIAEVRNIEKIAIDQGYSKGYEAGKKESGVPDNSGNIDMEKWEVNGLIVEKTEGNTKTTLNYKRKF